MPSSLISQSGMPSLIIPNSNPAVCVGERQAGRERAENVVDVRPTPEDIAAGLETALSMRGIEARSPFGDGRASERILEAILGAPARERLLLKRTTILAEEC